MLGVVQVIRVSNGFVQQIMKFKYMEKKDSYLSPTVKVIIIENTKVLCASTEGYGVSSQSYGEDDWE